MELIIGFIRSVGESFVVVEGMNQAEIGEFLKRAAGAPR